MSLESYVQRSGMHLISDRNKTVVVTYGGQPVEQFVFR